MLFAAVGAVGRVKFDAAKVVWHFLVWSVEELQLVVDFPIALRELLPEIVDVFLEFIIGDALDNISDYLNLHGGQSGIIVGLVLFRKIRGASVGASPLSFLIGSVLALAGDTQWSTGCESSFGIQSFRVGG